MFRLLILFSAICILLLMGFIVMEKSNFIESQGITDIDKKEALPDIEEEIKDTEKSNTFKKSKEIVKSIFEDAKSTIKDAVNPAQEDESEEDINEETENIEAPIFKTPAEKSRDEESNQWAVLDETQKILTDVGEMLK